MSGCVSCPQCGHVLFAIELANASSVQAGEVSPARCPTRVAG